MIISVKIMAILAVLLVAAGTAIYYVSQTPTYTPGSVSGATNTTTAGGGATSTAPSATTTTSPGPGGGESNAWSVSGEEVGLWLTSDPEAGTHAPVYVNGRFYNYTHIRMAFNLTMGDIGNSFVLSWRLRNGPYTAVCHNYMEDRDISISIDNATILDIGYRFSDGYWINATVYLKDTEWIWAFNRPPIIDLSIYATPHGAQSRILGAVFESSDPGSNGWWSSAIPLLPEDEGAACNAIVNGSPEADSLVQHLYPWMNLGVPGLLQPEEAFTLLSQLGEATTLYFTPESPATPYNSGTIHITYLGEAEYPGTNTVMHLYNITITTDTDYIKAWTIVASESIIPIEYHAYYPHGFNGQSQPVKIEFIVLNADIEHIENA